MLVDDAIACIDEIAAAQAIPGNPESVNVWIPPAQSGLFVDALRQRVRRGSFLEPGRLADGSEPHLYRSKLDDELEEQEEHLRGILRESRERASDLQSG